MDAAIREVLEANDDPLGFEVPGDDWSSFPRDELLKGVVRIQAALDEELATVFQRDVDVQDASFLADLFVVHATPQRMYGRNMICGEIRLRFSNFGRMYTIDSFLDEIPAKYPVDRIRSIVEAEGWTYIPADALDETYDGHNLTLRNGKTTWWIRFFDYL